MNLRSIGFRARVKAWNRTTWYHSHESDRPPSLWLTKTQNRFFRSFPIHVKKKLLSRILRARIVKGKNTAVYGIWSMFVSLIFTSERRSVANKQEYTRSDTACSSWTRDCICSKIFFNWRCGVVITSRVSCKLDDTRELKGLKQPKSRKNRDDLA